MARYRFLGFPLGTRAKAMHAAHEFAELVGAVINATVSHAPITFVEVEGGHSPTFYVAHVAGATEPAALPLTNGNYLYVLNHLGLRRKERYLTTLEYRYTYQATPDDDSWIFRYEYVREPQAPYPYPTEHLHVNARPTAYTGERPFPGLHLPTGRRITIERLCRHLIAEHGVTPISPNWETTVADAEAHFRDIQTKRALS